MEYIDRNRLKSYGRFKTIQKFKTDHYDVFSVENGKEWVITACLRLNGEW